MCIYISILCIYYMYKCKCIYIYIMYIYIYIIKNTSREVILLLDEEATDVF